MASETTSRNSSNTVPETTANQKKKGASWSQSPHRVWLRRALFQVHLWIGIVISAYAIIIGLTGSALVFREEFEQASWPALYHVDPIPRQTTWQQAVDNIEAQRPGWKAFALRDFSQPQQTSTLLMRQLNRPPTPNYRQVSFNPYTGHVLLDRLRYGGFLGLMGNLHVYLMGGQSGLLLSGAMAFGLLILCFTGLVLWWPGVARWAGALLLNPKARWKRLNWELHSVVGFWACAALLVVTTTGLDFAFPDQVGKAVAIAVEGKLSAGDAPTPAPHPAPHPRPATSNPSQMNIDQALAAARQALPAAAPGGYLSFPATPTSNYKVTGYYTEALPYSQLVRVTLDGHTGAVLSYDDTRNDPRGSRVEQYFTTIHFGSFGGHGALGLIVKLYWVLLGIVPALLAVTGLIMYWNRKLRPAWLRMQKTKAA